MLGRIKRTENPDFRNFFGESDDKEKELLISSFQSLLCYNEAQLQSAINLAVAITTHILAENIIKKNYDPIIEKAIPYIENHLHKDLSVNILCAELNISKNILYEHFKYTVKSTVSGYITERRMLKACKLLSSTEKPISVIAEECGIHNYTYFIKIFKKRIGVTPYKYRSLNT